MPSQANNAVRHFLKLILKLIASSLTLIYIVRGYKRINSL